MLTHPTNLAILAWRRFFKIPLLSMAALSLTVEYLKVLMVEHLKVLMVEHLKVLL